MKKLLLSVALGAMALRLADISLTPAQAGPALADFHAAFLVVGAVGLVGLIDVLGLPHDAGSLVSRHGPRKADSSRS